MGTPLTQGNRKEKEEERGVSQHPPLLWKKKREIGTKEKEKKEKKERKECT